MFLCYGERCYSVQIMCKLRVMRKSGPENIYLRKKIISVEWFLVSGTLLLVYVRVKGLQGSYYTGLVFYLS